MPERRPFDVNLRSLATRHSPDFLQWFLGEDVRFERTLDSVMVSVERRADFLVSFQDQDGQLQLLHAEFQLQIDEVDPAKYPPFRMFEYAALTRRCHGQVPLQILVLLENSAAARRIPDYFAEGNVRVSYRVIRLWEEDPQLILDSGLTGLLPLVPLMAGSSTDLLEESLTALEERLESSEERTELMKVAALLASIRTKPNVILSILRGRAMVNLMEDTPLGQQLLREREARIREAGLEVGREEGRQHVVELTLRQLQRRLRALPPTLVEQVSQLSLTNLDELSLALLDFSNVSDLQTWLEQQS